VSWADFTATWETDVKAGSTGSRRRSTCRSSGEAASSSDRAERPRTDRRSRAVTPRQAHALVHGQYANGVAEQKKLGIRFQAIVPLQIIGGTGVGDAGANAYARAMGVEREAYLARFGAPLPPANS